MTDETQALHAALRADAVIETHLSRILLAGDWAYKLKKPIRLPFADFRSIEARRHCCEEELRLNRRLAPALYVDVLPVFGSAQAPRLGAAGEQGDAIDWVLRMRRFPPGSELDALVRAGTLRAEELDAFAARIARLHADAPAAPPGSGWGTPEQVVRAIGDVFGTLAPLLTAPEAERLEALRAVFSPALHRHWAARRAGGFVREGHGDLHLANVVRLEGEITAFDCIEFSPALRWIDTLADVAFFTMDLHAHGRPAFAWRFLDAYLAATGDYEGLAVLRPYEIYRALVRAMAVRLRRVQGGAAQAGPDYLACAESLARPVGPRLLITHGLSGSGKSTVAARLLETAGAVRLRSDVERKRLHGLPALADSAVHGVNIYTPEATARTFTRLADLARAALCAGYPVIVDAAFLGRAERDAFHALARKAGVPFAILHCHASTGQMYARVQQRRAAGNDPSEADTAVLARQQQTAEPLAPDERALVLGVDTGEDWSADALHRRWMAAAHGSH